MTKKSAQLWLASVLLRQAENIVFAAYQALDHGNVRQKVLTLHEQVRTLAFNIEQTAERRKSDAS